MGDQIRCDTEFLTDPHSVCVGVVKICGKIHHITAKLLAHLNPIWFGSTVAILVVSYSISIVIIIIIICFRYAILWALFHME